MITFIKGRIGKSRLAIEIDNIRPAHIFHEGATAKQVINTAERGIDVIICCPQDFPKEFSCNSPIRFIEIQEKIEKKYTYYDVTKEKKA